MLYMHCVIRKNSSYLVRHLVGCSWRHRHRRCLVVGEVAEWSMTNAMSFNAFDLLESIQTADGKDIHHDLLILDILNRLAATLPSALSC
jgi:hypothetical protein